MARDVRRSTTTLAVVTAFTLTIVGLEGAVRALEPRLPEPQVWYHETAQAHTSRLPAAGATVVAVGNSSAGFAIDASQLGADLGCRAYNASLPASFTPVTRAWLDDVVLGAPATRTLVWGVNAASVNSTAAETQLERYRRGRAVRPGILGDLDRTASRASAIVRHRTSLRDPDVATALVRTGSATGLGPEAYAERHLAVDGQHRQDGDNATERERRALERGILADYAIDEDMLALLADAAHDLEEADVDLVMALLPLPARADALFPHTGAVDAAHRQIEMAAVAAGIPVVDVTDGFDDADFLDFTHLRPSAASRLTDRLAEAMMDLGLGCPDGAP